MQSSRRKEDFVLKTLKLLSKVETILEIIPILSRNVILDA